MEYQNGNPVVIPSPDSVGGTELEADIDVSSKGFNADKVDGHHASSFEESGTMATHEGAHAHDDIATNKSHADGDGTDHTGVVLTSEKGANNGVAELDEVGNVPAAQLPSYVDDVEEYANLAAFPGTGETSKIYIALDTEIIYRWSGSVYAEISASLALGETLSTAYRGDRGKLAYEHSQVASGNPHDLDSTDMEIAKVGTPAYSTLQHYLNTIQSSAIISGGAVTDAGSGQINVTQGEGIIKITSSEIGVSKFFKFPQSLAVSLTDNILNWIYVDYNSGTPQVSVTTDFSSLNHTTKVVIGRVYRDGTILHILNVGAFLYNYMMRACLKDFELYGFTRASGLILSEIGSKNIFITAGIAYCSLNRVPLSEFNSSTSGSFSYWYRDGGSGWTKVVTQTQINNLNYDDGDGTLGVLSNNQYGVHWVYQATDGHVDVVYGQESYTLAGAQDAQPPNSLPDIVTALSYLSGRIIIAKSGNVFTEVKSAFKAVFQTGVPINHDDLGLILGDGTYHFNEDDYKERNSNFRNVFSRTYQFEDSDNSSWTTNINGDVLRAKVVTLMATHNVFGASQRFRSDKNSNGDYAQMRLSGSDDTLVLGKGVYELIVGIVTGPTYLPNNTQDFKFMVGLSCGSVDPTACVDGVSILIANNAGTPVIQTSTMASSSQTLKNSVTVPTVDSKWTFKIVVNADRTQVAFYYWNFSTELWVLLTAVHTTNIPATATGLTPFCAFVNYVDYSETVDMHLDYVRHTYRFTNTI